MQPSSAAYVLNVRLYTYRNSNHRDSSGDCCDYFIFRPRRCKNDCDNIFTFCLRGANDLTDCPLGSNRFRNFRDSIDFPSDDSSIRSFSSRESWPVSFKIFHFYFAYINVRKFNGFDPCRAQHCWMWELLTVIDSAEMILLIILTYLSIWTLGSQHHDVHTEESMDEADLNWALSLDVCPTSMEKIVWPIAFPLTMKEDTLDVVPEGKDCV